MAETKTVWTFDPAKMHISAKFGWSLAVSAFGLGMMWMTLKMGIKEMRDDVAETNETAKQVHQEQAAQGERLEEVQVAQEELMVEQQELQNTVDAILPEVYANSGFLEQRSGVQRYKVVNGDTWWGIAAQFDMTTQQLSSYNPHIHDHNALLPGDHLWVMEASEPSGGASIPITPGELNPQ